MIQTAEQIFIVFAYRKADDDWQAQLENIKVVEQAIACFSLPSSIVKSVILKPHVFKIPYNSDAGTTLNSELIMQLQNSLGAIIFVDHLKPNVAYELGFFHGQGKPVLLIASTEPSKIWSAISDLAGASLHIISGEQTLLSGVHNYLNSLYSKLSLVPVIQAPELPLKEKNSLKYLLDEKADIVIPQHESDFGTAMTIDTWGGIIFRPGYNLLQDAKFKILLRSKNICTYSIYFLVHFIDAFDTKRAIQLGITSNRSNTGFEANERNMPGQRITNNWCMLTYSFKELLTKGQVLGNNKVIFLERIRFRADFNEDRQKKVPSYEVGYLELIGIDS